MDRLTKVERSRLMSKVRNKNTDIEIALRKALWARGLVFRVKNNIFGKPDIFIKKYKIVIFCDGDFWHGKTISMDSEKYDDFWKTKIIKNTERDIKVNSRLTDEGWKVFRFWKSQILKQPDECVDTVVDYIRSITIIKKEIIGS